MNNIIGKLLKKFHYKDVIYVHWKSNNNIFDALSTKDDFDVLVDPNDRDKCLAIINELGFLRAISVKDKWQNNIYHFLRLDNEDKTFVHLHLHFALPIGYDFDKNIKLPIEIKYMEGRVLFNGVYLPRIEYEYILLVIRIILKNGLIPLLEKLPWDQYKILKRYKVKGVINGSTLREFQTLSSRIDRHKLPEALDYILPELEFDLFSRLEKTIVKNDSIYQYFVDCSALNKMLSKFKNNSTSKSFFSSFYRINRGRFASLIKDKAYFKKKFSIRGKVIAFVGGDGAGKSTNIDKLTKVLSRHLWCETIHVGRPQKTFIGSSLRLFAKALKLLSFKNAHSAICYIALAYERKKAFDKADNIRVNGGYAILDRIPLDGVTAMDCPRIHLLDFKFKNIFSKVEKYFYSKIGKPDLLFALKLDPKIALLRRPEDDASELMNRSGQIWNMDFSAVDNAIVIDTSNDFEYVEEAILCNIWILLNININMIEIVGVASSGKSTSFNKAKEELDLGRPMLKNRFSLNAFDYIVALYVLIRTRRLMYLKSYLYVPALLKNIKLGILTENERYVLDQGPIYIVAALIKEVPELENLLIGKLEKFFCVVGKVFYLHADTEDLYKRLNSRSQNHRIKGQSIEEMKVFVDRYTSIYNSILSVAKTHGVKLIDIDTGKSNIDAVSNIILGELSYSMNKRM